MWFDYLKHAWRSEIGCVRSNNEDAVIVVPREGAFFVADGMGGGVDGEIASSWTVEGVTRALNPQGLSERLPLSLRVKQSRIVHEVANVSKRLWERSGGDTRTKKCGSTLAGIVFDAAKPEQAITLHAGDSRVYRLRKRKLSQLTRDHNLGNDEDLIGMKLAPRFKAMLTRGVGISQKVELEINAVDLRAGDVFLVCSDGLSAYVEEKTIARILAQTKIFYDSEPEQAIDNIVSNLIEASLASGGRDNCSVCVVYIADLPEKGSEVLDEVEDDSVDTSLETSSEAITAATVLNAEMPETRSDEQEEKSTTKDHINYLNNNTSSKLQFRLSITKLCRGLTCALRSFRQCCSRIMEKIFIGKDVQTSKKIKRIAIVILAMLIAGFGMLILRKNYPDNDVANSNASPDLCDDGAEDNDGCVPELTPLPGEALVSDHLETLQSSPGTLGSETNLVSQSDLNELELKPMAIKGTGKETESSILASLPPAHEVQSSTVQIHDDWIDSMRAFWRSGTEMSWIQLRHGMELPGDSSIEIKFEHPDFGVETRKIFTELDLIHLQPPAGWLDSVQWEWASETRESIYTEWRQPRGQWHTLRPGTRFLSMQIYDIRFEERDPDWMLATGQSRLVVTTGLHRLVIKAPQVCPRKARLKIAGKKMKDTRLEVKALEESDWVEVANAESSVDVNKKYKYQWTRCDHESISGEFISITGEVVKVSVPDKWVKHKLLQILNKAEHLWMTFDINMPYAEVSELLQTLENLEREHEKLQGIDNRQRAAELINKSEEYGLWLQRLDSIGDRIIKHMSLPLEECSLEVVCELAEDLCSAVELAIVRRYPLDSLVRYNNCKKARSWFTVAYKYFQHDTDTGDERFVLLRNTLINFDQLFVRFEKNDNTSIRTTQ